MTPHVAGIDRRSASFPSGRRDLRPSQQPEHPVCRSLKFAHRGAGVQLPHDALALGSGSCRDFAVLMMEAARYWGFGARFVTGYIQMGKGQHGAAHAWTEIFSPGAGWHGLIPPTTSLPAAGIFPSRWARAGRGLAAVRQLVGDADTLESHGGIGAGRASRLAISRQIRLELLANAGACGWHAVGLRLRWWVCDEMSAPAWCLTV